MIERLLPSYLLPLAPELFLCLLTFVLLLHSVYLRPRITPRLLALACLVLAATLTMVIQSDPTHVVTLNNMFVSDTYTILAKTLLLAGAICVLLVSGTWLSEEGGRPSEFLLLTLFSTLGLMLLISAQSLLAVYMGLELSSLALYVLAAFSRDHAKSSEAGLKYFVLGALASGMLLYGISLIYGFTGSINFDGIAQYLSSFTEENSNAMIPRAVVVGVILVMIAFCFKLSAAPFHMWTPDVYEGAPTPVTAFFAVAPKIAAMLLLVRLLLVPFADMLQYWQQVVIVISILSMLVGAFAAIMQTNLKRLLAYSSIGHVGFMMMGVASGTSAGVEGVLIYLGVYLFMSAGAFGCVLLLRREGVYLEQLSDMAGLSRAHPVMALLMALFMFSMAGVPPMAGFFGKMYVILAVVGSGLTWLAVIGLLTSVVACFYYLKIVKIMYFDEPVGSFDTTHSLSARLGLAVSAIATIGYVFIPSPLISHAKAAAEALLP